VPSVASETPDASIAYRRHVDDLIASLETDEHQGFGERSNFV
jgi:hypothetical protein